MKKPILGITMGDPFGNGPEITVRALNDKTIYDRCRPLVVGDMTSMEYALKVAKKVSGIDLTLNPVQEVKDAKFTYGTIEVLDMGLVPADKIPDTADQDEPKPFGIGACALGGEASFQYVKKVIELAMAEEIDATPSACTMRRLMARNTPPTIFLRAGYPPQTSKEGYAMRG